MRLPLCALAICAVASLAAALPASAASWTSPSAVEQISNASTGAGVTGWSASISTSLDTGTGAQAGDAAGSADVTITSALYGDFTATDVPLTLAPAAEVGCAGTWAALFATGTAFNSPLWEGFGWSLADPSFVCMQDLAADKPVTINVSTTSPLGFLWNVGTGLGSEALAGKVAGFRWTGTAALTASGADLAGWDATSGSRGGETGIGSGSYVSVGGNPKAQLRDMVRRNVAQVTRGLAPATAPATLVTLDTATLASSSVPGYDARSRTLLYDFSGLVAGTCLDGNCGKTVEIKGASIPAGGDPSVASVKASGLLTVIIRGGNLKISSDLYYPAAGNNLVVFVVLKDETNPRNGGNVYMDPGVTNLVGTFVADGSLLNVNAAGTAVLSSADVSSRSFLRRQLLLYGSLVSANTVGGSQGATPVCPYGSDVDRQGATCAKIDAAKYDLTTLRTFFLGTSRKPSGMSVTVGAPAYATDCSTGTGAAAFELPRWSQNAAKWDAQPWAWAGKSKCFQPGSLGTASSLDDPASNLRIAPAASARAAVVAEFNAFASRADLPILRDNSNR